MTGCTTPAASRQIAQMQARGAGEPCDALGLAAGHWLRAAWALKYSRWRQHDQPLAQLHADHSASLRSPRWNCLSFANGNLRAPLRRGGGPRDPMQLRVCVGGRRRVVSPIVCRLNLMLADSCPGSGLFGGRARAHWLGAIQ